MSLYAREMTATDTSQGGIGTCVLRSGRDFPERSHRVGRLQDVPGYLQLGLECTNFWHIFWYRTLLSFLYNLRYSFFKIIYSLKTLIFFFLFTNLVQEDKEWPDPGRAISQSWTLGPNRWVQQKLSQLIGQRQAPSCVSEASDTPVWDSTQIIWLKVFHKSW